MRSFQSQPEQSAGEPKVKNPAEEHGRIVMRDGAPRPLFFAGKRPKRSRHSRHKVAFFHFRYYEPAFKYFTEQVLDADFVPTPTPTRATIKRGEEMSADYVCTPFKHIIGDYAAALEQGADTLVQVTGFCRLNYSWTPTGTSWGASVPRFSPPMLRCCGASPSCSTSTISSSARERSCAATALTIARLCACIATRILSIPGATAATAAPFARSLSLQWHSAASESRPKNNGCPKVARQSRRLWTPVLGLQYDMKLR